MALVSGHRRLGILFLPDLRQRTEIHLPCWLNVDLEERQRDEPVTHLLNISCDSTSVIAIPSLLEPWNAVQDNLLTNAYFPQLIADFNYFNHSCYQSRISAHICQQLLCNKSDLNYYIKRSLAKQMLLDLFALNCWRNHN